MFGALRPPRPPRRRGRKHSVIREQMIADARTLRVEGGLTNPEIATALNVSRSTVYSWLGSENPHGSPDRVSLGPRIDFDWHASLAHLPCDVTPHGHSHEALTVDTASIDAALSDALGVRAHVRRDGSTTMRFAESDDIVYRDEPEPLPPLVPGDAAYAQYAGMVAARRRREADARNKPKRFTDDSLTRGGTLEVLTASHANRYTPRIADAEETD